MDPAMRRALKAIDNAKWAIQSFAEVFDEPQESLVKALAELEKTIRILNMYKD